MVKRGGLVTHGHFVLLGLILSLAIYIVYLSRVFILPVISAAIFSYVTFPFYEYLVKKTKMPKLSSFYTVIILTCLVLIPILVAFSLLAGQTISFVNSTPIDAFPDLLSQGKDFMSAKFNLTLSSAQTDSLISGTTAKVRDVLISSSLWIINGISSLFFQVIFILIFMYYFYIYGPPIYGKFSSILPFSKDSKTIFHNQIQGDIRALFLGQGLVALIQGILGGIGFMIAGLPNIFLWSFIMILSSFIPIVGAWLIWLPAAIFLLIKGNLFAGFFLLVWGFTIISNIDNLLRPIIVNKMSKIDFLVILIGVIIGIKSFNLIGIVVGPLLISILITLIKIYYEEIVSEKEKFKNINTIKKASLKKTGEFKKKLLEFFKIKK